MSEYLPCPFCGEDNVFLTGKTILCSRCSGSNSIKNWNTRVVKLEKSIVLYRPIFHDKEFNRTFSSDYLYPEPKTDDDRYHDYKLTGWVKEEVFSV